ncbi:MAG: response regulator [Saprospiraceae bacterium]|nr:response regulator [Saprospiraceae bacterium]
MKGFYYYIFLLAFLSPSVLLGQNPTFSTQERERLWQKIKKDYLPLPIVPPPCAVHALKDPSQAQRSVNDWLNEVVRMRLAGESDCVFQLLAALETKAKARPQDYTAWMSEKAFCLLSFDRKSEATKLAEELKTYTEQTGEGIAHMHLTFARLGRAKRQLQEAMQQAEVGLKRARSDKDRLMEATMLQVIGMTARDIYMERPEKNVPFLQQALTIASELKDTSFMQALLASISISYHYNNTKELDKAFYYIAKAANLAHTQMAIRDRMNVVSTYGTLLLESQDNDKAIEVMLHSVELAKQMKLRNKIQNDYDHLAEVYEARGEYDKALGIMDISKTYLDTLNSGYYYNTYGRILAKKGNWQEAAKFQEMAFQEEVKNYTRRNTILLTETETRMRTHEKELELNQQRKQRWFLMGIALLATLLGGGAVWAYWRNKKQVEILRGQKELIEKQEIELRQLDAAKTRFFANVSHELRTPLTLVLGPLASVLKRNQLENTDFTYIKAAQTHAKDLLNLVNEILDLSKVESGKMKLNETTVSLQPFTRRLVSTFESHAERLNIRYQFEYRCEKRLRIVVDTEKITRILNNLLSNAMKFTPKGGSVTVLVEDLAQSLRLTVRDTGRGIHPDDLPHVFDRFYQTNQTNTPIEGGTGIGLALCREFAEVMGGRIWAESTVGEGSCFFFEFPKKEIMGVGEDMLDVEQEMTDGGMAAAVQNLPESADKSSNTHHETILVVEDNTDLRAYIASILRGANYHIVEAENGLEALDILQNMHNEQRKPHLIISDIMMPVMDGFQLLKVLKDRAYFMSIPVVMLTARADIRDKLTALRIGVDDYLLKPFEEEELLVRIQNLLKNSEMRQQSYLETHNPFAARHTEGAVLAEAAAENATAETQNVSEYQEWLQDLEGVVTKRMSNFDLTAESIADDLAMSRAQFFRRLKTATGLTPNQYLLEVRFNHARHLLEMRKENSVKSVAYSVGMRDVKYFSQQFKARFGRLPSDYLN